MAGETKTEAEYNAELAYGLGVKLTRMTKRAEKAEAEAVQLRAELAQTSAACESYADEAKRYRARCLVTAEDVEAAGVTAEKVRKWIASQKDDARAMLAEPWHSGGLSSEDIADLCQYAGDEWGDVAGMQLLEEMAEIEVEP